MEVMSMINSTVALAEHEWTVTLNSSNELRFTFAEWVHDEWAGYFWNGEDDMPSKYTIRNVKDNVLPKDMSAVRVLRAIIKEAISVVNQSQTKFFYFTPSTKRKGAFYEQIFRHYLPQLKGQWEYQVIEKTWFYFFKVS